MVKSVRFFQDETLVSYNVLHKTEQTESPKQEIRQQQAAQINAKASAPSFTNGLKHNFTKGLQGKLNYQFGLFGRGYITFALFLLGLVVGRSRFFEQAQPKKKLLKLFVSFVLLAGFIMFIISLLPAINVRALMRAGADELVPGLSLMMLNDIKIVAISAAIITGFMLLYQHSSFTKYLDIFSPYGRMGLTNYEAQAVIGCMIFSMWAFGPFFQTWGTTELFILGIAIYVGQLICSTYWLKYYLYGPLEWFLRSATYLKAQPFRKQAQRTKTLIN